MFSKIMFISLLLCSTATVGLAGDKNEEISAVRAAILDYVEGVYQVQPERIKRSVHPSLRKHGFWYNKEKETWQEFPMNFEQLVDLAAKYNAQGRIPEDAPKEITIFEVKELTATAKLVAHWGQDYFHLAKYEGKWMITNVIWQSIPE